MRDTRHAYYVTSVTPVENRRPEISVVVSTESSHPTHTEYTMTDTITPEALAGLSKSDIVNILATLTEEETPEPTEKEKAETLVEDGDYSYAKGRVYLNANLIETAARIQNGDDPQIVSGSDDKRFCVLYRADNGDVVIQNLYKEA